MTAVVHAIRFVNVFFAAIVTGTLVFEFMVVVPTLKQFPAAMGARVHKTMLGSLPDRYMPLSGALAGIAGLLLLLFHSHATTLSTVFTAIGFVCWLVLFVSTFVFSRRTNMMIGGWSLDEPHDDYPQILQGWGRLHALRTTAGFLGLLAFVVAIVVY